MCRGYALFPRTKLPTFSFYVKSVIVCMTGILFTVSFLCGSILRFDATAVESSAVPQLRHRIERAMAAMRQVHVQPRTPRAQVATVIALPGVAGRGDERCTRLPSTGGAGRAHATPRYPAHPIRAPSLV